MSGIIKCLLLFLLTAPVLGQELNLGTRREFIDIVAPIITKAEAEIYETLPDFDARRYFSSIFWYKRDPDPKTNANDFRTSYMARYKIAPDRFAEGGKNGLDSDRGKVYMLLGEPDKVDQRRLPGSGARPGFEETWQYDKYDLNLRFVYDGFNPRYRLMGKDDLEARFEDIRNRQVLDRAEPYRRDSKPLSLPNLGFTKDVENLVAEDVHQLSHVLDYAFFKGDLNRTEVLVNLAFNDASNRGVDIHLAAFDPYGNKVREVKKLVIPVNGEVLNFTMPLEPDQYNLVMRLEDKDGRKDISRRTIDVPRVGVLGQTASSILKAPGLDSIPLFGFNKPKKYVFGVDYFPVTIDFTEYSGDRLYLMQLFYGFTSEPEVKYYLNHREVAARTEKLEEESGAWRMVVSLPTQGMNRGKHHIKSVFEDVDGNLVVSAANWDLGSGTGGRDMLNEAKESDRISIVQPAGNQITELSRVEASAQSGITIKRMYVYLNDKLILERDRAPWSVSVNEGLYSISGENTLAVVLDTDQGLFKEVRRLQPLRVKERVTTRAMQIYFNAFNEQLEFVTDIDLSQLSVTVDGNPIEPMEVERVTEPITYCFMIDTSFSMKDSFSQNIGALKKFIDAMRPEDRGYFVIFHSDFVQYLEPTSSKAVLIAVAESLDLQQPNPKAADRIYQENQTYLYDAAIASIHTLMQYSGRTVVLLVSDGVGIEGLYSRNAMLNYARQNDTVIYTLWLDNNPALSDDELAFLEKEMGGGEKFARKIGLSRFFAKKDARTTHIRRKVMGAAINEGMLKIMAEESGGFHYRVFKADRVAIAKYVGDIEKAVNNQFVMTLNLPVSSKNQEVTINSTDDSIEIRNKSKVKVSRNPLQIE
ncbi:MAG: GWxTD domain-containing protein [Acidobacteriota bacterium]|nr:GWxTD domain-containing protein [Acidobacteriota bacterium]